MIIKFIQLLIISLLLCISLSAQNYEILFDTASASGWFGGDNRPCCGPRNIAVAQSVFIEESINLETFSFSFTNRFDSSSNPTGSGHEVTLRLHIRDIGGAILQTEDVVVPDTYDGGWVTWSNINFDIPDSGKYIFSTYLVGGYDSIEVNSGQACDQFAGYPGGERYTKNVINDSDAVSWDNWGLHSWDANFWLTGTINVNSIIDDENLPLQFDLGQNYPNPFNPSTKIKFAIPQNVKGELREVSLKVYDVLGNEIVTLINKELVAGEYEIEFYSQGLPSGVYLYTLQSGNYVETKKMILLR